MRKSVKAAVLLLVLLLIALPVGALASSGSTQITAQVTRSSGDEPTFAPQRSVWIENTPGGQVAASTYFGFDGDKVTFTFTPDRGYRLAEVRLNGQTVTQQVQEGKLVTAFRGDLRLEVAFESESLFPMPKTGDRSHLALAVTLLLLGGVGGCLLSLFARRTYKKRS